jgi:hypothetical protein
MPALCPWPRDSLTYDGCCSHFSINESAIGVAESSTLIREEINRLDSERKLLKGRQYCTNKGPGVHAAQSKASRDNALENQRYKCTVCDLTFPNEAKLLAHQELAIHIRKAAVTGRQTNGRGGGQNAISKKKHWCEICQHAVPSAARLSTHLKGPRHAKKLRDLAASSKLVQFSPLIDFWNFSWTLSFFLSFRQNTLFYASNSSRTC